MLCFQVQLSRKVSVMRPGLLERMPTNLSNGHSLLLAGESGIIEFQKIANKVIAQSQQKFGIRRGFSLSIRKGCNKVNFVLAFNALLPSSALEEC